MTRLAGLLLVLLITAGCVGPKPEVRSAVVAPAKDGKATVTVVVANTDSGDGQIEVAVTLRRGEEVVGRADKTTELRSKETITLILVVDVPADAKELTVEARVTYPPE